MAVVPKINVGEDYKEKYGFFDPEKFVFKAKRGLSEEVVKEISWMKQEPEWMTKFRLRSLEIFRKKPMPNWGADLSVIDFENIFYYLKSTEKQGKSWDEVPADIKRTFDRLGVPEAERKFLAGVAAQYESEVVYHSQHQDAGGKMVHVAPNTTGTITSKSISKGGGRTSYRGLVKVYPGAHKVKSFVKCDALLLDDESKSDTYPYIECDENEVNIGHEATVSKVSDEQLFYLMSRGIPQAEAETMIVNGFIEPFTKELPLEYAVELNRLIQLEMEGSVG